MRLIRHKSVRRGRQQRNEAVRHTRTNQSNGAANLLSNKKHSEPCRSRSAPPYSAQQRLPSGLRKQWTKVIACREQVGTAVTTPVQATNQNKRMEAQHGASPLRRCCLRGQRLRGIPKRQRGGPLVHRGLVTKQHVTQPHRLGHLASASRLIRQVTNNTRPCDSQQLGKTARPAQQEAI